MKNAVGDAVSLGTVFLGVSWFRAFDVIILLIAFPEISDFVPNLL